MRVHRSIKEAAMLSPADIVVVSVIALLLFGGKKIPELAKGLGEGIHNFKSALKGDEERAVEKPEEKKQG
jgi:sec-independent protein translocase protein TatA